jgi:transposase, IS5 family
MTLKKGGRQMKLFTPEPEDFVSKDHIYRKILKSVNFEKLCKPLEKLYSDKGRNGYRVSSGFKCLFLQYFHKRSDRELEMLINDSLAARYFCGFALDEITPDHSYFSKLRCRIGTKKLAELFNSFMEDCQKENLIGGVFTFVDSSSLSAAVNSWNARDKAIADKENKEKDDEGNPTMNNNNTAKYSRDKDARYGSKGKGDNKFWYGFKRHHSVDCKVGLIIKTSITKANVPDGTGVKHVLPNTGAVLADKAYAYGEAQKHIKRKGLYSLAIKKDNDKSKDRRRDKMISKCRMPFEGVFSSLSKKARFLGIEKIQFQSFMESFAFNIKRIVKIRYFSTPYFPVQQGNCS